MKALKIIPVLSFLALAISAQAQDYKPVVKTDHIAIVVSDLAASARFYNEILGLSEITNQTKKPNIRWFTFADGVELHLINVDKEIQQVKDVHLALAINDLKSYMKFLREKGIPFESWQGEPDKSNDRPDGVKQVYIQDPDGYWIEINDANRF